MNFQKFNRLQQFLKIAENNTNEISSTESSIFFGKIINLNPGELLAMRYAPDSSSAIIDKLSQGQEFYYLDEMVRFKDFYYAKIETEKMKGWIASNFIEYYDEDGRVIFRGVRKKEEKKKKLSSSSNVISPISGTRVTSSYGMRIHPIQKIRKMHKGVDLRAAEGTQIVAPENGKITNIRPNNGGAGNTLYLAGSDGREWIFMHLSSFKVQKGDIVEQGQEIARSGATGNVTGPHLHLELKINGSHVDPLSVFSIPGK